MAVSKAQQSPAIIDLNRFRVTCSNCNLSELCLPRGIDKDNLSKLANTVRQSGIYEAGHFLFRAGDPFKSLVAIRTGAIKLYVVDDNGEEQILGFYFPGELLGLDAIETDTHTCNAVALETSSFCAFPYSKLDELCKTIPELRTQMFKFMSRELSLENRLLLTLGKRNADEKLEFHLAMSRQDIGNYLGLTIETVSRVLSRFNKEGLVRIDRKQVKLLDVDTLKRLSVTYCEETKKNPST